MAPSAKPKTEAKIKAKTTGVGKAMVKAKANPKRLRPCSRKPRHTTATTAGSSLAARRCDLTHSVCGFRLRRSLAPRPHGGGPAAPSGSAWQFATAYGSGRSAPQFATSSGLHVIVGPCPQGQITADAIAAGGGAASAIQPLPAFFSDHPAHLQTRCSAGCSCSSWFMPERLWCHWLQLR